MDNPLGLAKHRSSGTPKDVQKKVDRRQVSRDIKRIDEPEQGVPGSQ
ncbi:hypothetical protein [Enterobacter sp.]|nr:hypothetical protein [Enterobacter sp.]